MSPLLLDQGLPRRAAAELRERGWDVQHVGDLGMHRSLDEEIVAYAARHGLVVVTLDSDFSRLLATCAATTPSVVHIRIPRVGRVRLVSLLRSLVPSLQDDLEAGCIVSVDEDRARIRRLPIG